MSKDDFDTVLPDDRPIDAGDGTSVGSMAEYERDPWYLFSYAADPAVEWTKMPLDRGALAYTDPVAEHEFLYFFCRDQAQLATALAYIFGGFYFTLNWFPSAADDRDVLHNAKLTAILFLIVAVIILTTFVVEQYTARRFRNGEHRGLLPTIRVNAGAVYICGVIFYHTWGLFNIQLQGCRYEIQRLPEFDNTSDTMLREWCTEHIDLRLGMGLVALSIVKHTMRRVAVFAVLLVLATWIGFVFATDYAELLTHGARQVAVLVLFNAWATVVGVVGFIGLRSQWRDQFESAIDHVVSTQRVVERQATMTALLEAMVPPMMLDALLDQRDDITLFMPEATILFSDMASFTQWSSSRTAKDVVVMLSDTVSRIDGALEKRRGLEKVKTIGDAYWAVASPTLGAAPGPSGPLDGPSYEHATMMVQFGLEMIHLMAAANAEHPE